MAAARGNFTVTVTGKDVVTPMISKPDEWIVQSNLDLLLPHSEVCVFACYKQPQSGQDCMFSFQAMVDILKDSLAQLLVSHYALCGEMVLDSLGEPRLRCHSRGVQFTQAYADVEIHNLNWYNPDQFILDKLAPYKKMGVVSCYQLINLLRILSSYKTFEALNPLTKKHNTISVSMAAAKGNFIVTVTGKDVVTPMISKPDEWIVQSNLDLLLPHSEVCVFACYKQPQSGQDCMFSFQAMVDILKDSLAQLLVSHYALCGEMVLDSLGEPRLRCHSRGVQFTQAYADVEIQNLNWYNPDQFILDKLAPYKKMGVVSCYQVTEMKCGGIVVACTIDHRVSDGYGINMFMVAWADIARTKRNTTNPSYQRSLLAPRSPLIIDATIGDWYMQMSDAPPARKYLNPLEDRPSRFYYIEAKQLRILNSVANIDNKTGTPRTTFEAFCAFMWKLVNLEEPNKESKFSIGIVVDGRSRLTEGEKEDSKSLSTYFGNVLSIPYGTKKAGYLQDMSLGLVADSVHNFLKLAKRKDHFLNLIDWVESRRPETIVPTIWTKATEKEGSSFVVSYVRDFKVSNIDFGWGKPVFGGCYFPWDGQTGFVHPAPSAIAEGDWIVLVNLSKEQLRCVDKEAGHVLKPLTYHYLNSRSNKNKILSAL